jgi:hypothetical protein
VKVGIGTATPEEILHVKGTIRYDNGEFQNWGPIIIHPDVDNTGDDIIRFLDSGGAENMRIHTNGNIGKGTTSPQSAFHIKQTGTSTTSGIRLEQPTTNTNHWNIFTSGNDLRFYYNSVEKGHIDNASGGFVNGSDRRLKREINSLPNIIDKVMQLRPAHYYFKDDLRPDRKYWGFIAQEVEEIFPEIVIQDEEYKGLIYSDFAVLSIKAIQEQQEKITLLEETILSLKSHIDQQSKRNDTIEKELDEIRALLYDSTNSDRK